MASLVALDFPLGPSLVDALTDCAMTSQPFCVLDQRLSASARRKALVAMGATHVLGEAGVTELSGGEPVEDGDGLVMLTSGSSGPPKAVIHTWASLVASAHLTQDALRGESIPSWLPCLPPAHIGGLAVLLRAVLCDASLRWSDDLSEGPALGASHIAVVRTQLVRYDLAAYECVLVGGSAPPERLAPNVVATWGMTETGSGIVYNGTPLPNVAVTEIDGELCVQSPTLFRSYRHASRPAVIDATGASWFPTGDSGTVKGNHVAVRGRIGTVITTGGEKVWPEDLERTIQNLPDVDDVAICGAPDDEWGQRVVALVVARRTVDDAIRAVVSETIGPWAKPKEIHYVAKVPRTSNGKIQRAQLMALRPEGFTATAD